MFKLRVRQFSTKCLVVLLSLTYLFAPLKNEVLEAMHFIAHNFNNHGFFSHHDHSHNIDTIRKLQTSNLDTKHNHGHDHEFIDFLYEFLKDLNSESDSESPIVLDFKIDKHLRTSDSDFINKIFSEETSSSFTYLEVPYNQFSKKEKIPPQYS